MDKRQMMLDYIGLVTSTDGSFSAAPMFHRLSDEHLEVCYRQAIDLYKMTLDLVAYADKHDPYEEVESA